MALQTRTLRILGGRGRGLGDADDAFRVGKESCIDSLGSTSSSLTQVSSSSLLCSCYETSSRGNCRQPR